VTANSPAVLDRSYRFRDQEVRFAVSGSGPPLVLVHGTPFSSHVWQRIIPQFLDSGTDLPRAD
jgi:pimeloyl-ACP methyl ester carboxylesterase